MFEVVEHGGLFSEKDLPVDKSDVIDFSANLNPLGPPEKLLQKAKKGLSKVRNYPEPFSDSLREKFAEERGLDKENIIFGCGSTELIFLSANLFSKKKVAIGDPSFAEYKRALKSFDAEIVEAKLGTSPSINDFQEVIGELEGAFICSPHNPTGKTFKNLEKLIENNPETVFVIDRAYKEFENPEINFIKKVFKKGFKNVIVLYSLTKSFCIPGLRIGYLVTSKTLFKKLIVNKQPWSVGQITEKVVLESLNKKNFLKRSKKVLEREKEFLENSLSQDFDLIPSNANFFLIKVGDASKVKKKLLNHGLLVRDCSSFNLPRYIRVAVKQREENEKLVKHLRDLNLG